MGPIFAKLHFTDSPTVSAVINDFISARSLIYPHLTSIYSLCTQAFHDFLTYLEQPRKRSLTSSKSCRHLYNTHFIPGVYTMIITFALVFSIVLFLGLSLGFGPGGVVAGSLAAAFQSFMYGAFTPAAGIFATLTSMAMLGYLAPAVVLLAAAIAGVVTLAVGAMRGG